MGLKKWVYNVAVAIAVLMNFILLLKSCITNILMYKAPLKSKFKWASITLYFLVISLFSHDFKYTN